MTKDAAQSRDARDIRTFYEVVKVPDILKECWSAFDMNDKELSDSWQYTHDTHGDFEYSHASREYKCWFGPDTDFMVLQPWIASVTGHHGEFPDESESRCQIPPAAEGHVLERDREARQQFVDALIQLFLEPAGVSLSDLPYIANRSFWQLLGGSHQAALRALLAQIENHHRPVRLQPPQIQKGVKYTITDLMNLEFIGQHADLIFIGNPGAGKTFLAMGTCS